LPLAHHLFSERKGKIEEAQVIPEELVFEWSDVDLFTD